MNLRTFKFPEKFAQFKGAILFAVVLMLSNLFWKYNVLGDESESINSTVTFWGMDISTTFTLLAQHVAHVSEKILQLLRFDITLKPDNTLRYANGNSVVVIWSCTGLKQAYITLFILTFAHGPWLKKLWYIPLCLLGVYAFNIFRITFIAGCMENHPHWFEFLHLYLFKYVFYGIIFLMWVYWEERIAGKGNEKQKMTEPA
ncbi:MAG TPA: exosortase/archaeosortase family protein [Paludibacter sp.]